MDTDLNLDFDRLRQRLLDRLEELAALDEATREARAPVTLDQQSVGRLSRMDALQGQAMALATEQRRKAERGRIEAALKRMETGDYGYCTSCDEPIAPARLDLDPANPTCVSCAGSA